MAVIIDEPEVKYYGGEISATCFFQGYGGSIENISRT